MRGKESFAAELERMGREHDQLRSPEEWVKEQLRWEDWDALAGEAVKIAAKELRRRNRARDQVLPDGYDAESLAGQAVADLLEGKGRLVAGFTRSRLAQELTRLISRKVRLLNSLKEASVTRSEWEFPGDSDEPVSLLRRAPDANANGYEAAVAAEMEEHRERLRAHFEDFLAGEPELLRLLRCLRTGVTKAAEIARNLGVGEKAVAAARKRLGRRMAEFRKRNLRSDKEPLALAAG